MLQACVCVCVCVFVCVNSEYLGGGHFPGAQDVPPHLGVGIAIKGDAWVSAWYPAATELNISK